MTPRLLPDPESAEGRIHAELMTSLSQPNLPMLTFGTVMNPEVGVGLEMPEAAAEVIRGEFGSHLLIICMPASDL